MTWVFVLLLLAAVLISFEIILPGAVLGLLGLVRIPRCLHLRWGRVWFPQGHLYFLRRRSLLGCASLF